MKGEVQTLFPSGFFQKKENNERQKRCSVANALFRAGFRGGNWNNDATNERVSDRNNAANVNDNRNNNNGGRCARTSLSRRLVKLHDEDM